MDIKNDMNTKDKYSSSLKKLSFEDDQFNMENEEFIQVNLKYFFVFKFQSNIFFGIFLNIFCEYEISKYYFKREILLVKEVLLLYFHVH